VNSIPSPDVIPLRPRRFRHVLSTKVPQATLLFWVVKILSTTVGETGADLLSGNLHLGLTVTTWIVGALLAAALVAQFRVRRYVPGVYWTVVVLISVAGTLFSDNLVDHYGVPLPVSTALFGTALAVTFVAWWLVERTLSIHSIVTRRREAFYWAAILFAFALGTSAGDWFSEGMGLGYLPSAGIFAAVIALVALAHRFLGLNSVLAFWAAYVLTRPFGAATGDLLAQARTDGGLGFGTISTSEVFLVVILAAVVAFTVSERRRRLDAVRTHVVRPPFGLSVELDG
jgi:uncharacterized membrane-anchored protein